MTKVLSVVVVLCLAAVPGWSQFFPAPAPGGQPVPAPQPGGGMMPGGPMGGMPGPGGMGMGMGGPPGMMSGMMPGMGGGSVAIAVDNGLIFIAAQGMLTVFKLEGNNLTKIAQAPYGPGPGGPGYGPYGPGMGPGGFGPGPGGPFGMPGGGPPAPGGPGGGGM